jgi:hypothetical protein
MRAMVPDRVWRQIRRLAKHGNACGPSLVCGHVAELCRTIMRDMRPLEVSGGTPQRPDSTHQGPARDGAAGVLRSDE